MGAFHGYLNYKGITTYEYLRPAAPEAAAPERQDSDDAPETFRNSITRSPTFGGSFRVEVRDYVFGTDQQESDPWANRDAQRAARAAASSPPVQEVSGISLEHVDRAGDRLENLEDDPWAR